MVDIHNHILFGLDDGAKTIEESKEMLEMAYHEGITEIIFTPHYVCGKAYYDKAQMESKFSALKAWVEASEMAMQLYLGHEAFLDERLLEDVIEGKCNTLAGSRYLLLEFYKHTPTHIARQLLFQMGLKGYVPIIAHCERLVDNKEDLMKLKALSEMGCLVQINGRTILEPEDRFQKKWLVQLLKDHTISFIASDAHNTETRTPELREAYDWVAKKVSKEIAENIFVDNPMRVINNQSIT